MWRVVFIAFLLAHGAVHLAIWATPAPNDATAPFDSAHSWLLGRRRGLAAAWAVAAAALLMASGVGLWIAAGWWRPVAVTGLAVSFVLMVVYLHAWFTFIEAVNVALIVALLWLDWPSVAMVGA